MQILDLHNYSASISISLFFQYKLEGRYVGTCTEEKSCCPATVIQKQKNRFKRGTALHNHGPNQSQISSGTNSTSKAPGEQSQTSKAKALPGNQMSANQRPAQDKVLPVNQPPANQRTAQAAVYQQSTYHRLEPSQQSTSHRQVESKVPAQSQMSANQ